MLALVFGPLLQEYRAHRMARFTAWVLAYGLALWLTDWIRGPRGGAPGLLWFVFWIALLVGAGYYFVRLVRFIRTTVLWRLRRRLIVAYTFIAFVPILLILALVGLGVFILNGQFAAFLVTQKLREHFDQLRQLNRVVAHETYHAQARDATVLLDHLQNFYLTELSQHAASYPGLEITIEIGSQVRAFHLDGRPVEKPVRVPGWFKDEEFAGIVLDKGELALRAVDRGKTPVGELVVILSQPFTPGLLNLVGEGIGPVSVVTTRLRPKGEPLQPGLNIDTPEGNFTQSASVRSTSVPIPEQSNLLDATVLGASSLDPILWAGSQAGRPQPPAFVLVTSRVFTLGRQLFATLGEYSKIYVLAFKVVAIVFIVIEGIALIIGVRLTSSITRTVDHLYDATERVKKGDFSYRIGVPASDQLSALGEAFDSMTASVERLLRESQEKSRLESELEIARQVQRELFPQGAPEVRGLELYGVCKAARSVSGDYYDFLRLGQDRVGLVLGDVSGKGISAALLMAAIQSALRAQFYDGFGRGSGSLAAFPTADIVARLNLQLFENTPVEKYVTFFFAHYDGATRRLTYTNAGHLPPVLFRRNRIERLRAGGTVVGLFGVSDYEQAEIDLEPGDLLLAFTDGITEPENIYGEEFGEERVLEVAQRTLHEPVEVLVEEIYRSINDWTGSPELQDDMTLLVAKAVA
jgi:sigma-B regulation protein RsbU (phosphoserine phosphatase)